MDKILQQVSKMTAQLHQLTDAVRKFEKCKACKKKYYRSIDDEDVHLKDKPSSLEPPLSVSPPPKSSPSNSPVSCSTPLPPEKTSTRKQISDIEDLQSNTVLIGSPTRGLYVPQQKVKKLPKSTPKLFALKLFELVSAGKRQRWGAWKGKPINCASWNQTDWQQ